MSPPVGAKVALTRPAFVAMMALGQGNLPPGQRGSKSSWIVEPTPLRLYNLRRTLCTFSLPETRRLFMTRWGLRVAKVQSKLTLRQKQGEDRLGPLVASVLSQ